MSQNQRLFRWISLHSSDSKVPKFDHSRYVFWGAESRFGVGLTPLAQGQGHLKVKTKIVYYSRSCRPSGNIYLIPHGYCIRFFDLSKGKFRDTIKVHMKQNKIVISWAGKGGKKTTTFCPLERFSAWRDEKLKFQIGTSILLSGSIRNFCRCFRIRVEGIQPKNLKKFPYKFLRSLNPNLRSFDHKR